MTTGGGAVPAGRARRAAVGLLLSGLAASGCSSNADAPTAPTAGDTGRPTAPSAGTASADGSTPPAGEVPDQVEAVLALLAALNATAGGPVKEQRAQIERSLDPGQVRAQESCGPATTTLSFEPVPDRARPRPGWTPPSGEIDGEVWGIPVLLRIHAGNRVVGTDLTELHVVVGTDGAARLPAMCVN